MQVHIISDRRGKNKRRMDKQRTRNWEEDEGQEDDEDAYNRFALRNIAAQATL